MPDKATAPGKQNANASLCKVLVDLEKKSEICEEKEKILFSPLKKEDDDCISERKKGTTRTGESWKTIVLVQI